MLKWLILDKIMLFLPQGAPGHQFVLLVYRFRKCFPKSEIYGLVSQLRRAAVSIPAIIAEGFKKKTKPDKMPRQQKQKGGFY